MSIELSLAAIEEALACVKRTLDKLTARGENVAAFELARAQYAASIRNSWPANLGSLAGALRGILEGDRLELTEEERAELRRAIETFSAIRHE